MIPTKKYRYCDYWSIRRVENRKRFPNFGIAVEDFVNALLKTVTELIMRGLEVERKNAGKV